MNVKDVKLLNDRIEAIQVQKTKAETKKEMLISRLKDEIANYEKVYGVKLSADSLQEVFSLVSKEKSKIAKSIQDEYNLKIKVVTAIESGNITEAVKLLGLEKEEKGSGVVNTSKQEYIEVATGVILEDLEESREDNTGNNIKIVEGVKNSKDEEDYDFGIDESNFSDSEESSKGSDEEGNVENEDNKEEFDLYSDGGDDVESKVEEKPKSLSGFFDFGDVDFGNDIDEDEEDSYEDFGFGDMLKGSKLDI